MLDEGPSSDVDTAPPTSRKASTQAPSTGEAPPPLVTLWSDVDFNTLRFKSTHIPLSKEFPTDYQDLHSKWTSLIISMNDNL